MNTTNERCVTENRLRTGKNVFKLANSTKNKEQDQSCFITFENSNVKKLKKEIERQSSKSKNNAVSSQKTEDSNLYIPPQEKSIQGYTGENTNYSNYYNTNTNANVNGVDFMRYNTKRSLNLDGNNKNSFYNINTDSNSPSTGDINSEDDNEKLRNWLMQLGFKNANQIDFSGKELSLFKDGYVK